jgi:ribosomal protein S1
MNLEMTTINNGNGDAAVSFASMLEEYEQLLPQQGQFLQGEVLRIENDAFFIDVGAKRDAIVPFKDLERFEDQSLIQNISRGDKLPVYVLKTPVGDEELLVSLRKGLEHHDWIKAEEDEKTDKLLKLKIVGHNKGGIMVAYGHLEGFVPNSLIPSLRNFRYNNEELVRQKAKLVGETLAVKILEVNLGQKRLVMSANAAEQEQRLERFKSIEEGQIVTGRVENLVPYGAFVDIGHVTGLLHISQIAWQQIGHPSEVLERGQEIEVRVERIDLEKERIGLSRKVLLPSPWEAFAEKHEIGDLIEGQLTGLVDFGAFVTLPSQIEGLVHVSEINLPVDASPAEVLQVGERVLVRIINIEPETKRIGLSLRRVSAEEEIAWLAEKKEENLETAEQPADELPQEADLMTEEVDEALVLEETPSDTLPQEVEMPTDEPEASLELEEASSDTLPQEVEMPTDEPEASLELEEAPSDTLLQEVEMPTDEPEVSLEIEEIPSEQPLQEVEG